MSTTQTRIPLDTPIKRGETEITELQIRKPSSGELRGVILSGLLLQDVDSLILVLPRITVPVITKDEVMRLDPADLAACSAVVGSFFVQKRQKQNLDGLEETSRPPVE